MDTPQEYSAFDEVPQPPTTGARLIRTPGPLLAGSCLAIHGQDESDPQRRRNDHKAPSGPGVLRSYGHVAPSKGIQIRADRCPNVMRVDQQHGRSPAISLPV